MGKVKESTHVVRVNQRVYDLVSNAAKALNLSLSEATSELVYAAIGWWLHEAVKDPTAYLSVAKKMKIPEKDIARFSDIFYAGIATGRMMGIYQTVKLVFPDEVREAIEKTFPAK